MITNIIIASVITSGITAVLGALLSIADSILNDYGEVKIVINNGKKELKVKGGRSLLSTLAEYEIYVPSACGGKGTCGACKAKVVSDVGAYLPTETPHLTLQEMKENVRISCQIKLKKDIDLELPEAIFNIKKFSATVEEIEDLTHDIKKVYLRLPDGLDINYIAGYYAQFEAPAYFKEYKEDLKNKKVEPRFDPATYNHPAITVNPNFLSEIKSPNSKAYSISSDPNDKNHLEFLIRLVPGGLVTTFVHRYLKVGDNINLVGPMGEFFVHYEDIEKSEASMICVAGGSGMAPFKAIFYEMIKNGKMNEIDVWYFFGAATPKDIYYTEWLEELHKKYRKFHFVPALSGPPPFPKPSDWVPPAEWNWSFDTGLITDVMDKYLKDNGREDRSKGDKISSRNKQGYLCGSSGMLKACCAVMEKNGMSRDKIYFDEFG